MKPPAAWPRLADLRDADALCSAVLDGLLRTTNAEWGWADYEDRLQELRLACWQLYETRWDPARGLTFASYASWKLRCWAIDKFFRQELGRDGGRARRELSLDALVDGEEVYRNGQNRNGLVPESKLERALATREDDAALDRAFARGGLEPNGDRRALLEAEQEVLALARTPKGVSRLLRELRDELRSERVEA